MLRFLPIVLSLVFAGSLSAQVSITISVPDRLGAGDLADVRYTVENTSDQPLTGVNFDMQVSFPANITDVGASDPAATCGQVDPTFRRIGCTFPTIPAHESREAVVQAHFPPGHYTPSIFVGAASAIINKTVSRSVVFYREYAVTTPADAGPGSLRQAILDTNAQCDQATPCRINFEIPGAPPAEGWFTVAPASPLPVVAAPEIVIDAARGPDVFLDGRGAGVADGLSFTGSATVRGLAIGRFQGNGVLLANGNALIEHDHIGVDPAGAPAPNALRGVVSSARATEISGSVISHNGRSGVFVTHAANIHDNTIEYNGASGVYLSGTTVFDAAFIASNVIAGNRDFGVAFPPDAKVAVQANTFGGNGWGAIDVGLDGPTLRIARPYGGPLAAPRITSAHYDAASGDTIIEGLITDTGFPPTEVNVYIYANQTVDANGFAEGEKFLGTVKLTQPAFTLRVHEDLRGLWIDANLTAKKFDEVDFFGTSELGLATRVE